MVFDQMSLLVERAVPFLRDTVQQAALFDFPNAYQVLPLEQTAEMQALLCANFFLPFPVVAVDDRASCVVFADTVKDQVGFDSPRRFFEYLPCGDDLHIDAFPEGERGVIRAAIQSLPRLRSAAVLTAGLVYKTAATATGFHFESSLTFVSMFDTQSHTVTVGMEEILKMDRLQGGALFRHILKNIGVALREVAYLNSPSRFVVESNPPKRRERNSQERQRRIDRSHERPVYTLMTPKEIVRKFADDLPARTGTRKSPCLHARRRHYRLLSHERFVHKRGTRLLIPAKWIGPTEFRVGRRLYRVRVEL